MKKEVKTRKATFELITYDVWGNAIDGYDVNDVYKQGNVELTERKRVYCVGTPHEFTSWEISDSTIQRAIGTRAKLQRDEDSGHPYTIYVNRASDGYPLCELRRAESEKAE